MAPASAVLSPSATPQAEAARLAAEHRQRQPADVERHWCSGAKATHQQLTHAKRQAVPEFDPRNVKAFADAVEASAKGEVSLGRGAQALVRERLLSQWAQQLQPRCAQGAL